MCNLVVLLLMLLSLLPEGRGTQFVCWVQGVLHMQEALFFHLVSSGEKAAPHNPLSCFYHLVQTSVLCSVAAGIIRNNVIMFSGPTSLPELVLRRVSYTSTVVMLGNMATV